MELTLKKNMSNMERIIRTFAGLFLLALSFGKTIMGIRKVMLRIIAVIEFAKAISAYCIIYDILGKSYYKNN